MRKYKASGIIVLVTTFERPESLVTMALQSIANQTLLPSIVIIINDGEVLSTDTLNEINCVLGEIPVQITHNKFSKGAAGSWNTGIDIVKDSYGNNYIAILDDDDDWDPSHLQVCYETAKLNNADAVVSGLRLWVDGKQINRPLIKTLTEQDFLVGNPGWQGSNTFVKVYKLVEIGGFRDGMQSLNDRYLAIKLLELPNFNLVFTEKWTANWRARTSQGSLSSPGSIEKKEGLKLFWEIFSDRMNTAQKRDFFQRAASLFKISEDEIVSQSNEVKI